MRRIKGIELDTMACAFLECALWASTDNADDSGGAPLDANYGLEDFAPETLKEAQTECAQFYADDAEALDSSGASLEQIGHDFFLTRNRHGTGFWDRGDDQYPADVRKHLTDAAHVWGTWEPYVGDDGVLYSHG